MFSDTVHALMRNKIPVTRAQMSSSEQLKHTEFAILKYIFFKVEITYKLKDNIY